MAYCNRETGRTEVYLKPFPAGEGRWQVSTHGGVSPQWRRDGKELLFFDFYEHAMMAVDVRETATGVELGTPHQLFRANFASFQGPYCVSADGQRFLINGTTGEPPSDRLTLVTNWPADLKK